MSKKYTYCQIQKIFNKQGWRLISQNYKNNKQKLDVECSKGHVLQINLNNFLTGWRCTECYGKRYLNINIIRKEFCDIHYILLSKIYKNSFQKLKFQCDKGHIHFITYSDFKQGKRCGQCSISFPKTYIEMKNMIKCEGYQLLSKAIINTKHKISVKCPAGHVYRTSYNNFNQGSRCRVCFENINGDKHHLWQGGISNSPYSFEFNVDLKDKIRKRDYFKCVNCDITERKHVKVYGVKLYIHHIDYNKDNCKESNLATTCNRCNSKANFNRDYWYAYCTYLIENN